MLAGVAAEDLIPLNYEAGHSEVTHKTYCFAPAFKRNSMFLILF